MVLSLTLNIFDYQVNEYLDKNAADIFYQRNKFINYRSNPKILIMERRWSLCWSYQISKLWTNDQWHYAKTETDNTFYFVQACVS
ncbi:MAG: hypothetical protein DRP78_04550 [Candidatus Omnitrophota bacterium]|nr:MAG: hypothetical protein DRP78_04550 [Candidatus Omnitrophota bacterium]